MAPTTARREPLEKADGFSLFRLTVEQFQGMYELGILKPTPKVELIDGYLVEVADMAPPHSIAVGLLMDVLVPLVPRGWHGRIRLPVTLPPTNQPLPDGAVARGARTDYATRHPGPGEVELVVEVSDSTLDDDRETKGPLYARHRIPAYWIVNIPQRQLEAHTRPRGGKNPRYLGRAVLAEGDTVSVTIGGVVVGPIAVADLLPPA